MTDLIRIRASSLPDLFDCPARWEARNILGLRMKQNGKALLGTAIHASTAAYDSSTINGEGVTVDEAAGAAVDAIHKPGEDVEWDDSNPNEAEKIALALHGKYCNTVAPHQNYIGVEVGCDRLDITDLGITLTGTTDRVREINGGFGIVDIKSGKQAVGADGTVATKGHAFQMGVYELLASTGSGIQITEPAQVVGLNTAKTDKGQRVGSGEIEGAREVLVGSNGSPGVLQVAADMIRKGVFYGNPRSMLCNVKFCPKYNNCNFRK